MQKVPGLVAVIELLLKYHRKALRILLGEYEPTLMELSEVVRTASVGEEGAPRAAGMPHSKQLAEIVRGEGIQHIVDDIGGWGHLAEAARYYRESFPTTWAIFADHVLSIVPGGASRLEEEAQLQRIADRYGIKRPATVCEKRRIVPEAIARYAEMMPAGELRLLDESTVTATDVEEATREIIRYGKENQRLLPL